MNPDIAHLYEIAQKPRRLVLGLMSGTSLDGLDMALCRFTGKAGLVNYEVLHFSSIPYDEVFKQEIRKVFSKTTISLEQLCLLHPWVAQQHARMINTALTNWNVDKKEIDLVASHGQTIYHAPQRLHQRNEFGNATLQIGDGDHLAMATGIITISDFRQKNIAADGEGAPLAAYGDYLLFHNEEESRLLLNIGGIANFSWLPAGKNGTPVSTDTGPGNTLMDAWVRKMNLDLHYDKDGNIAAAGRVNSSLLTALKADPFFESAFPKTTGPELFSLEYLEKVIALSGTNSCDEDVMATLNRFTAETIAEAIIRCSAAVSGTIIYCSGGGLYNKTLIRNLEACLPGTTIKSLEVLGVNPDAKEALLFAVLADACVCGYNNKLPGNMLPVAMGKISLPR